MKKIRKMKWISIISVFCSMFINLLVWNPASASTLLGSGVIFAGGETVPPTGPFAVAITFRTIDPNTGDSSEFYLFNGLVLDDSDVGETFYVDQTNDPVFLDAVGVLTNGRIDDVGACTADPANLPFPAPSRCSAGPENGVLCLNTDFVGSTIDRIGLRIEDFNVPGFNGRTFRATLLIEGNGNPVPCALNVSIDIKPGSDPNSVNINDHGVIPVAILGGSDLNVSDIDPASVKLAGMAVKAVGKSNKLLAHIENANGDAFDDLVVQIQDSDGIFESGCTTATLTGSLFSGRSIEGADSICIVP
jgi:hypothetical protein